MARRRIQANPTSDWGSLERDDVLAAIFAKLQRLSDLAPPLPDNLVTGRAVYLRT